MIKKLRYERYFVDIIYTVYESLCGLDNSIFCTTVHDTYNFIYTHDTYYLYTLPLIIIPRYRKAATHTS